MGEPNKEGATKSDSVGNGRSFDEWYKTLKQNWDKQIEGTGYDTEEGVKRLHNRQIGIVNGS